MCDIFGKPDALNLLKSKHVLLYGDSNIRALYKDLIWLLTHNTLISANSLKKKLEPSFCGDKLLQRSELHKGRDFVEVRNFEKNGVHLEFHFITRCYTDDIERRMNDIREKRKSPPDVIVMNSVLWDITRWGPKGVTHYKDNLVKLMKLFQACLPSSTLVIWTTALPISSSCYGGFLVKQVEFLKHTLRYEVMEANMFARQVVVAHGFDILDLHYHLRMQIHRRIPDGIHWLPLPMRHMTNLLLTHIALSWNQPLPGNFQSPILAAEKELPKVDNNQKVELPVVPSSLTGTDVNVSPAQIDGFARPREIPPWRKRLQNLPTRRLNEENLNPNYAPWHNGAAYINVCGENVPSQNEARLAEGSYNIYGEWVPPNTNGPVRERYSNRHNRRHNPYF